MNLLWHAMHTISLSYSHTSTMGSI